MNDLSSWPELRSALLEETQPAPGMEERVLAGAGARRRRPAWALAAVAAALTVTVVAALLVAGAVLRQDAVPAAPAASPPPVSTRALGPVSLDADGSGWVVEHLRPPPLAGGLTVLHTADGGAHWTRQLDVQGASADLSTGPAGRALLYVPGLSTGAGASATLPQSSFYSTTDGGADWRRWQLPASGPVDAVQMKDGREAWLTMDVTTASGPPDAWVVYHTTDGAATWQRQTTVDLAATFGASDVAASRNGSGQYGIYVPATGGQSPLRFYVSTDGGARWQAAPLPSLPDATPRTGIVFPAIRVLPDGHLVARGQDSVRVSDDGGQSWSEPRPLPSPGPDGPQALDSAHWWLITRDGQVFSSADEGRSWAHVGSIPRGMTVERMAFTDATAGWAIASTPPPGFANVLLVTGDGGRTWRTVTPPHAYHPRVPCGAPAEATVTAHAQLVVRANGTPVPAAVPEGVGVTDGCRYRLFTTGGGTIDIARAPGEGGRTYTLGDLLDIWGVPSVASFAAGSAGRVTVQVDGRTYGGDPRAIPLRDGTRIAIDVTGPTTGG